MATVVVRSRENASRNTDAVFFGKPVTRGEYLEAKMIADPLSILDCDMPVDGCGAFVLTTADRAKSLREPPAYIVGGASLGLPPRRTVVPTLEDAMASASALGRALWRSTGMSPSDVTHVHVHDGFSWYVYLWLEALGLFPEGEAFLALQDDTTAPHGTLPLNTSGGSLGTGRLHGTPYIADAVRQIQGQCGDRKIADPSVGLVQIGAPFRGAAALVLSP
jgi:acetyl-CoA acetyltransferase